MCVPAMPARMNSRTVCMVWRGSPNPAPPSTTSGISIAAATSPAEAAGVDAVEAYALQQAPAERVVGDRHVDEFLFLQQPAQRSGFLHALYFRDGTGRCIRRHRRRR